MGSTAVYPYVATDGTELRKTRHDEADGKSFTWERRAPGGAWTAGLDGRKAELYRVDEIRAAIPERPVLLVEGEKCADLLSSLGAIATTAPNGAGSTWEEHFSDAVRGRLVAIIPDHDLPGFAYAERAEEALRGVARAVCVVPLPTGLLEGEDVADWLPAGSGCWDRLRRRVALGLVAELEAWATSEEPPGAARRATGGVVSLSEFSREKADPVPSILGDGAIAKQSLNVLAGEPGTGKTLLAINLALSLAARRPFLGLAVPELCPVLFLEAEGNRDRFRERVETARESMGLAWPKSPPVFFAPRGAVLEIGAELEHMIRECGPGLVILDTIGLFHEGDENSATDWRKYVVKPLRRLIDVTGAAFLVLHHFGKPSESRTGGHRMRGTSAMKGDADTVLLLDVAKTDPGARVLTFDKIKNGPPLEPVVLRFDGRRAVVELTDGDAVTAMKPRLGTVQRIVNERGELRTKELVAAIMGELELGKSQAEGLIPRAHEAGLIEKRRRGVYGPVGRLLREDSGEPLSLVPGDSVPF